MKKGGERGISYGLVVWEFRRAAGVSGRGAVDDVLERGWVRMKCVDEWTENTMREE